MTSTPPAPPNSPMSWKIANARSVASRKANAAYLGIMECEIALTVPSLPAEERTALEFELAAYRLTLDRAKADHAATGKEWKPRPTARILRERREKLGDNRHDTNSRSAMTERKWLKDNQPPNGRNKKNKARNAKNYFAEFDREHKPKNPDNYFAEADAENSPKKPDGRKNNVPPPRLQGKLKPAPTTSASEWDD